MKLLKYLLLVAVMTLLGASDISAQNVDSTHRAYFEYIKGVKCVNIDGTTYKPISPSIYVAKWDTIEKMQHPLHGKPALVRDGYALIAVIWEPLAFKNSECTSKQVVDLYRKKKFTPKDAPQAEIRYITKRDTMYDWCIDSVFIDTSKVVYRMPIDTGGLFVNIYPDIEVEKYFKTGKKAHTVFKFGIEAILWNGEKAPQVIIVPKVQFDSTKVDTSMSKKDSLATANKNANAKKSDESVLLRNVRIVAVNEIGLERAHTRYVVSEDSCFICAQDQKLYRLVGEVAIGAQYAPRRPLGDEQFQVSVMLEARYRYLGSVTEIPNSNGWNRLSLGVTARADYGPFVFQLRPKWSPGLGIGWTAGISYNIIKWSPKQGSQASKVRLPSFKV